MGKDRKQKELESRVDALQNRVDTYYSNLLFHYGTDKVEDTPPPFYKGGIEAFRRDVKAAKLLEYVRYHTPSDEEALAYMLSIGMDQGDLAYAHELLAHKVEASDDFKAVLLWVHFVMRMEEDEQALAEAEKELADRKKILEEKSDRGMGAKGGAKPKAPAHTPGKSFRPSPPEDVQLQG